MMLKISQFSPTGAPPKKVLPDVVQLHKGRCSHPADTEAIDPQDLSTYGKNGSYSYPAW